MFRRFDEEEVGMVVVMHVHDILAHTDDQATMEKFAAELGGKFKVKWMEKFVIETASRAPASLGVPTLSQSE